MYSLLILSRSAWLNVKSGAVELTEEICERTILDEPFAYYMITNGNLLFLMTWCSPVCLQRSLVQTAPGQPPSCDGRGSHQGN